LLTIDFLNASGNRGIGHSKVHMYDFHYLGVFLYINVRMKMPAKQGFTLTVKTQEYNIKCRNSAVSRFGLFHVRRRSTKTGHMEYNEAVSDRFEDCYTDSL